MPADQRGSFPGGNSAVRAIFLFSIVTYSLEKIGESHEAGGPCCSRGGEDRHRSEWSKGMREEVISLSYPTVHENVPLWQDQKQSGHSQLSAYTLNQQRERVWERPVKRQGHALPP